jgi:hypothetical protein
MTRKPIRRKLSLSFTILAAATALVLPGLPFGAEAAAAPAQQGAVLVHWWQAQGNAKDSVGEDNGTLDGVEFGPGVNGGTDQAFFFGGSAQVVFNNTGGNRGRGDFTFSFAIWTTATVKQAIWEKRAACDSDGTSFWGFRMLSGGRVVFEVQNTAGKDYIALTSTTTVNDGAWHWVAVTRHYRTVLLYVDGTLEATGTSPTTANVQKDTPMRAGVSTCDGVDGTHAFTGELDDLQIWASALRQPQIQALRS